MSSLDLDMPIVLKGSINGSNQLETISEQPWCHFTTIASVKENQFALAIDSSTTDIGSGSFIKGNWIFSKEGTLTSSNCEIDGSIDLWKASLSESKYLFSHKFMSFLDALSGQIKIQMFYENLDQGQPINGELRVHIESPSLKIFNLEPSSLNLDFLMNYPHFRLKSLEWGTLIAAFQGTYAKNKLFISPWSLKYQNMLLGGSLLYNGFEVDDIIQKQITIDPLFVFNENTHELILRSFLSFDWDPQKILKAKKLKTETFQAENVFWDTKNSTLVLNGIKSELPFQVLSLKSMPDGLWHFHTSLEWRESLPLPEMIAHLPWKTSSLLPKELEMMLKLDQDSLKITEIVKAESVGGVLHFDLADKSIGTLNFDGSLELQGKVSLAHPTRKKKDLAEFTLSGSLFSPTISWNSPGS
jgi:hypothetical protein